MALQLKIISAEGSHTRGQNIGPYQAPNGFLYAFTSYQTLYGGRMFCSKSTNGGNLWTDQDVLNGPTAVNRLYSVCALGAVFVVAFLQDDGQPPGFGEPWQGRIGWALFNTATDTWGPITLAPLPPTFPDLVPRWYGNPDKICLQISTASANPLLIYGWSPLGGSPNYPIGLPNKEVHYTTGAFVAPTVLASDAADGLTLEGCVRDPATDITHVLIAKDAFASGAYYDDKTLNYAAINPDLSNTGLLAGPNVTLGSVSIFPGVGAVPFHRVTVPIIYTVGGVTWIAFGYVNNVATVSVPWWPMQLWTARAPLTPYPGAWVYEQVPLTRPAMADQYGSPPAGLYFDGTQLNVYYVTDDPLNVFSHDVRFHQNPLDGSGWGAANILALTLPTAAAGTWAQLNYNREGVIIYDSGVQVYYIGRSISLDCNNPPDGAIGVAYTHALVASGGTAPYTLYEIIGGSLPPGLALGPADGIISGTPTTAGSYSFTAQVTDSVGETAQITCLIDIPSGALIANCDNPPAGSVGVAYSHTLLASGGTPPYTFVVVAGALPDGLTLDPNTGVISGTPTTAGTFAFMVRVTDSARDSVDIECSIVITEEVVLTPCF